MKGEPTFYFSLRSPYSWLALEDIVANHSDLMTAIRWVPFWDPDRQTMTALEEAGGGYCYAQMSREKHFYILQDVRRLVRDRGLRMTWPIDRDPWWEVPHLACLAAARHGRMVDLATALSRARWTEGRDICAPETVRSVAESIGLVGDEMAAAVDDPGIRDEATEIMLSAYRDGVFGVPFFVRGNARFWGVERLPVFASAVDPVSMEFTDIAAPVPAGADLGHAGGCG